MLSQQTIKSEEKGNINSQESPDIQSQVPVILAYGFRPFFLLAPLYLSISTLLWGLFWSGLLPFSFLSNPLEWHLYENLFGVTSAMMIGFILTAVPEFYKNVKPVAGKTLLYLVIFWILGRISFWLIDYIGIFAVAIINIPLLLWVVLLIIKPILTDPQHRHISLIIMFIVISLIHIWFFMAKLDWVDTNPLSILKASIGAFMILVLLALRRISMVVVNYWLDKKNISATYVARPPRYNIAIICLILYTFTEFLYPNNSILIWLAFAVMAAVLNIINDFFLENSIFIQPFIWPLFSIFIMLALGYGLIGLDYLIPEIYHINDFRHLITLGALGIAFYMVLIIVAHFHTGRDLAPNPWIGIGASLILCASIIRGLVIPFIDGSESWAYLTSAIMWTLPFIGYLILYGKWLVQPRADGLSG